VKKQTSARPFFDTNVLIYAFKEEDRRASAARILLGHGGLVGVQTLNEFAAVARRKLRMSWQEVREALAAIQILCPAPIPVSLEIHEAAVRISERHGYQIFDSLMIAAALAGHCTILYSEDLQHRQVIEGLTIQNPFLAE